MYILIHWYEQTQTEKNVKDTFQVENGLWGFVEKDLWLRIINMEWVAETKRN